MNLLQRIEINVLRFLDTLSHSTSLLLMNKVISYYYYAFALSFSYLSLASASSTFSQLLFIYFIILFLTLVHIFHLSLTLLLKDFLSFVKTSVSYCRLVFQILFISSPNFKQFSFIIFSLSLILPFSFVDLFSFAVSQIHSSSFSIMESLHPFLPQLLIFSYHRISLPYYSFQLLCFLLHHLIRKSK